MKRVMGLIVALLLAVGSMSAAAEEARTGVDLSYDRIVEMAQYMRELATGDYLDIKQVPENLQTVAEGWAAGIGDTPRLVVQLDIENLSYIVETRVAFSQEPDIVCFEAESTAVSEVWQYLAYYASTEAGVTESGYEEIMTVNGYVNAATMYAEEGREGSGMYIVLYDQAAPLMYIVCAENGAVSIQGLFLPSTKLAKCQNYGQVSLWLMLNGFSMTCREILPE